MNRHNEDTTHIFDEVETYCNTHYGTHLASIQLNISFAKIFSQTLRVYGWKQCSIYRSGDAI